MTEELFRNDAYLKTCDASVTSLTDHGGICLDKSIFYPTGGGQPGDNGVLVLENGTEITIATTIKGEADENVIHVPDANQILPALGDKVTLKLNWQRRHILMRMHSAMHLVCAVVPCGVTGGQCGEEKSRLDFDIGEQVLNKEDITAKLNELIQADHPVTSRWISDEELDNTPDLIRTMSVSPPRGKGRVRLISIAGDDVDLQPCGGTHIAQTGEIGKLRVSKIENKGKRNRRFHIVFDH